MMTESNQASGTEKKRKKKGGKREKFPKISQKE
jgi:hypothetical protein